MEHRMETGVLGPLVLACHGTSFVPTAPKPRQLLAFLTLNANHMVRSSECISELWGSNPPKSAMSTVQTYILHIRQILRNASKVDLSGALVTRNQGYQLTVAPQDFDRFYFYKLADLGREAASGNDDEGAATLFARALSLWRGPALVDVQVGALSTAHLVELEETRKVVLEQRIEADLRLGRHVELLDELAALTAAAPTHENLHAQLMVALYRSGRPARALGVFRTLRQRLAETLGIEPTPRLRRLNDAILRGDPVLDVRAPHPGPVHAGSTAAGLHRRHGRYPARTA
jgi:DNA-binding SARP family transcriptional activator